MKHDDEPPLADLLLGAPGGDLYDVASHILMAHSSFRELRNIELPEGKGHWVVLHDADGDLMSRVYHRGLIQRFEDLARRLRLPASSLYFVLAAVETSAGKAFHPVSIDPSVRDTATAWPRLICINPDNTEARTLATDYLVDLHDHAGVQTRFLYEDEEAKVEILEHWRDIMSLPERLRLLREVGESPRHAMDQVPPRAAYDALDSAIRE